MFARNGEDLGRIAGSIGDIISAIKLPQGVEATLRGSVALRMRLGSLEALLWGCHSRSHCCIWCWSRSSGRSKTRSSSCSLFPRALRARCSRYGSPEHR